VSAFSRAPYAQQADLVTTRQAHESSKSYTGPIFDVHLHTGPPASVIGVPNPVTEVAAAASAQELRDAVVKACKKYNITHAMLNGWPGTLQQWAESDAQRFILAPMVLNNDRKPLMSVSALRSEIQNGRAEAIGEIMSQ
jgi:hypothetical protein